MQRRHNARPKRVVLAAMGSSLGQFISLANGQGGIKAVADEVWAINATAAVIQHHRAFVMDDVRITLPKEAQEGKKVAQGILGWLPHHPGPVYTSTAYSEYPALVEFPLKEVLQHIGGLAYLNTSCAYAIAYAMYLGVEELHLYGCDFTYPDIHVSESGRGCAEFLIGRAATQKMRLVLPITTTLLDSHVPDGQKFYGYPEGMYSRVSATGAVEISRTPFPPTAPSAPTEEPKA